jgi:hypothetical protein
MIKRIFTGINIRHSNIYPGYPLALGMPMTLLGLATAVASIEDSSIRPGSYNWVIGTGLPLTTSSISLFIFFHKYRKRSAK